MDLAAQQFCYLFIEKIFVLGGYFSAFGISQAKEHIACAVFARIGLEKSHHLLGLDCIC